MTALESRGGSVVAEVLLGAKSLSGECLQSLSGNCGSTLELSGLGTNWVSLTCTNTLPLVWDGEAA